MEGHVTVCRREKCVGKREKRKAAVRESLTESLKKKGKIESDGDKKKSAGR